MEETTSSVLVVPEVVLIWTSVLFCRIDHGLQVCHFVEENVAEGNFTVSP